MTSLERARQFLHARATRLALKALPLAAMAVVTTSATAGTIYIDAHSGSCYASSGQYCRLTSPGMGALDADWIQVYSEGRLTAGSTEQGFADFILNAGSFIWDQRGYPNPSPSDLPGLTIPVSWEFWIHSASPDSALSWNLSYSIIGNNLGDGAGSAEFSTGWLNAPYAAGGSRIAGLGSIQTPDAMSLYGYSIQLQVRATGCDTDPCFEVDIPGGRTLDLNPAPSESSVPEPGALFLIAPGLAAIALRRFRRA